MSQRPLRPCPVARCPNLVRSGRCDQHGGERKAWHSDAPVERIRGRKLQALRRALFARHPLCEPCEAAGRTTLATIRDHRINLADGGLDDSGEGSNESAICEDCHTAKTQAEAARGQRRDR